MIKYILQSYHALDADFCFPSKLKHNSWLKIAGYQKCVLGYIVLEKYPNNPKF